ncbi:efflux RND transporter periplasmic adaptor subunit [Altererythrobacter indicus]|uniref:Efflux RND transporter periplasmic adaptor subunit n=1 Tax=Altericroceibacterium indicum TaxID=374177 RepID=A0A845A5W3_9SPHN|nr:efflux RND transporter periplasmic adaptor subunit [Altericroceibacterium indicum]MXP25580.1 efflux RND transporter periplasmic adaptor subunit [Altericroceibacterium indicum]
MNYLRIAGMAAALAMATACSSQQAGSPKGPVEVGYVTLTSGDATLSSELTGRITATIKAEVRPQVDGVIRKRLFTEGSYVRAGQQLYQIDPRSYSASRDQIAAQIESAKATLQAANAKADRYRTLVGSEAVSQQDIDDAIATAKQAKASLNQYQANLRAANLNIEFTRVLAPISGRIGRSNFTPGALVTANQTAALATIQQLDPVFVDITQSSAQLLRLRRELADGDVIPASTSVTLILEDGTKYPLPGKLEFSEVDVDEDSGTVTLRARFPNPQGILLPGMFVRVETPQAVIPNAVMVPQQGISRDAKGNGTALVVDKNNKVVLRTVTTAEAVGNKWVATAGLKAGDRLIIEGTDKVKPGDTVKAVKVKIGG